MVTKDSGGPASPERLEAYCRALRRVIPSTRMEPVGTIMNQIRCPDDTMPWTHRKRIAQAISSMVDGGEVVPLAYDPTDAAFVPHFRMRMGGA